jgi:hypothetical protein
VVSRFTHIILIACLSLASVFAPVVAGKVICRADGGHRAVEVAHDATGCAVVASLDDARGDGSKTPCDDQAVGDLETAVQGGKVADHAVYFAIAFDWAVCSYLSAVDTTPPHIPFACSSDLLPSAISQGGLSTIVLLI